MESVGDYLFAGSTSGSFLELNTGSGNTVKLFKSSDGDDWTRVPGGHWQTLRHGDLVSKR